jgi:WD40 repeat protein/serine/threonine protein kinase
MNPKTQRQLRISQVLDEMQEALGPGRPVEPAPWEERFPELADEIPALLNTLRDLGSALECWKPPTGVDGSPGTHSGGEQPTPGPEIPLPRQIGRYRILKWIGSGGMGTVYQAHDPQLDRLVAVKVPRFDVAPQHLPNRKLRFLREARAAARIRHPGVCPIHDVGEDEGRPFVVMAFVDGPTLIQLLQRQPERFREPAEVARLIREVAEALQAVHAHGIIHRDLKLGNILIDHAGRPLLTDFGLARVEQDAEKLSTDGAMIGTPAYMPPEQAAGDADRVGPWSDVYSLGVILYRLLTGRLPYEGTGTKVLWKIGRETPPTPSALRPGLHPALEAIVLQAMAPDPRHRYQTARQFAAALEAWLEGPRSAPELLVGGHAGQTNLLAEKPTPTLDHPADGEIGRPGTQFGSLAAPVDKAKVGRRRRLALAGSVAVLVGAGVAAGLLLDLSRPPGPAKPFLSQPLEIKPGTPLSPLALVSNPAPIKDVISWSLEPRAHHGFIQAVAYSPDGTMLASAGFDGSIRLWEPKGGELLRVLLGHMSFVAALAWSPDGKYLASAGWDPKVRLWDIASGRQLQIREFPFNRVYGLAWAPSGKMLAVAEQDGAVHVWDLRSDRFKTYAGHTGNANTVAWSPGGATLASGGRDGVIRLWDIASDKPGPTLEGHKKAVTQVAWSADGVLASCGQDGTVRLWDAAMATEFRSFRARQGVPISLAWAHTGKMLAAGSTAGEIEIWEPHSAKQVLARAAHSGTVNTLAWSPLDQSLATGGGDGNVCLWDTGSGKRLRLFQAFDRFEYRGLAWSPVGDFLAVAGKAGVHLWKTSRARLEDILPEQERSGGALAWSSTGKYLVLGSSTGQVSLWDVPGKKHVRDFGLAGPPITMLAWSPTDRYLAVVPGGSKSTDLWEMPAGRLVRTLEGHPGPVLALSWAADSKRLATAGGSGDGTVRIWEVSSGKNLRILGKPGGFMGALAWSPDGKRLLAGGTGENLDIWDPAGGSSPVRTVSTGPVHALAWSPDGKTVAMCGNDGSVTIASVNTLQTLFTLRPGLGPPCLLAWAPDSKTLATGNSDGRVRFWSALTGELLGCVLPGPDGRGLVVSREGHYWSKVPVEQDLVFVVQQEDSQEILAPKEFSTRYSWKNNPASIQLRSQ